MMERSSRFISLSGFSGIGAGICALAGAWLANSKIQCWVKGDCASGLNVDSSVQLLNDLLWIATFTFIAAFIAAFIFTWLRSKKNGTPIWGSTTIRLFWNTTIPMVAGGVFLIKLMQLGEFGLIAPGCLIFYGLALVNASKYTFDELRYLGYGELALGIMNLWYTGYGLYFWAMGFGILHILYGIIMWYRYERTVSGSN
jgi:hypothetical protein